MLKLFEKLNTKKIFKYGAAALLLVIPLYPKFPVFGVSGTYVAIRIEDFIIAALGIFWLVYLLRDFKKDAQWPDKLNRALLLFFSVGLLSVISAIFLTETVRPHIALLHWARRIEYIIPFFIGLLAIKSGARPRFFAEVFFIASFLVFVYGAGQIYADFPVISTQNQEYSKGLALRWIPGARVHSTFAGHYDLAAFLVMVFPLAIASLFVLKKIIERAILLFVVILPAFWIFLQTESRISFFAFLVGVSFTLWLIRKRVFIIPFIILSLLGMLLFSDLGLRYQDTIKIYKDKLIKNVIPPVFAQETTAPEDRSTSIRFNVEWPRAVRAFSKNPFLGTGYSSITLATDNDYLRLLGEVGLVGALAFLLVLGRLGEELWKRLKSFQRLDFNTAFVAAFFGGFVGILINATFIDVFEASKVAIIFWTLAGLAVGLAREKTNA